jgi:hypothetical protein
LRRLRWALLWGWTRKVAGPILVAKAVCCEQAGPYELVETAAEDVVDCCRGRRRYMLLYVNSIKEGRVLAEGEV